MMPNDIVWAALILPVIYAIADRYAGSRGLHVTGLAVGTLLGGLAGYIAGGWPVAVLGLIWAAYRSVSFKGGAAAPTDNHETQTSFFRHVFIVPLGAMAAKFAGGQNMLLLISLLLAYVVGALGLAVWYGSELKKARAAGVSIGSQNAEVEVLRGFFFGAALAIWVIGSAYFS